VDRLWIDSKSYPQNVDNFIHMLGITSQTPSRLSPKTGKLSPISPELSTGFAAKQILSTYVQVRLQADGELSILEKMQGYPHFHIPYYYCFIYLSRKKYNSSNIRRAVEMWITRLPERSGRKMRANVLSLTVERR